MHAKQADRPSIRTGLHLAWMSVALGALLFRTSTTEVQAAVPTPAPLPAGFTQRRMVVRVVETGSGKPLAGVKVQDSTAFFRSPGGDPPVPTLTDAKGEAQLQLNIPPGDMVVPQNDFTLSFEHSDYASRVAHWHSDGGSALNDVPPEFTMKLGKGGSLGGVVKDDHGRPIGKAQILINAYGGGGYEVGTGQKRMQEFSQFNSPPYDPAGKAGIQTGSDGRWSVRNFPLDLDALQLTVIRGDGSDAKYVTSIERFGGFGTAKLVAIASLREGTAEFVLASGFTVRGRVLNDQGGPVARASVTEAYGMGNPQARGQTQTDQEGRFQFPNRRARQGIWRIDAPGYALACEVVTLKPDMPETVVRLSPAKPAILHVQLEDGKPAAGAAVSAMDWRNEGYYLNLNQTLGADGILTWTNAPLQEVRVMVTLPGISTRQVKVKGGREDRVTLSSKPVDEIKLTVRALSARNKQPLESFEVLMDREQMRRFSPWLQSTNGVALGSVRASDFRPGMYPQFLVRVSAKGYLPKDSESLELTEGDRQLEVVLEPDTPIKGIVKDPEGNPVESAYLVVNRDPSPIFLNQQFQRGPVQPPSYGNFAVAESGPDGGYELSGTDQDAVVVAMHETGYAQIPSKELRKQGTVTLHPWERMEGTLKIGSQPGKAGQRIGLNNRAGSASAMGIYFDATTDEEGHFVFDRIPAGAYLLFRYMDNRPGRIVNSHRQDVDVLPGKVAQVQMGGTGVRVVGRARASRYADLDWTVNRHTLTAKVSGQPTSQDGMVAWEDYVRRSDFEAANRRGGRGPDTPRQYLMTFDREGSFYVDDVEPGEYTLEIKVTEPPPISRPWMEDGKLIAAFSTNLVVQAGQGGPPSTFQVAPLILALPGDGAGPSMPTLAVELLEGKSMQVGGKKGVPQAVMFWAPWSERSCQALRLFREGTSWAPPTKLTSVAVALEADSALIKKVAQAAEWQGALAKLAGGELIKAFTSYGLNELPLLVLVDSEGQMILKTSNSARVGEALAEVTGGSAPTQ